MRENRDETTVAERIAGAIADAGAYVPFECVEDACRRLGIDPSARGQLLVAPDEGCTP